MKLSEGFRLRCGALLVIIGVLKCVSSAPNVTPLGSNGKEALVITSTSTAAPDNAVSGESWETDVHEDVKPKTNPSKVVKPEIYSFRIQSDIKYRYSRTYVTSRVANLDAERSQETTFRVVLPEAAFISKFVMEIDGKAYEAYVKGKEEAKQVYQQAQSQGQSAGLVEVSTRNSNIFNVNVNIKAQSKVTFNLTYEELLSRKLGRYEQSINISPEQLTSVKDFQIVVNIEESQNITSLRVPNLRNDLEAQEDIEGNNADAIIVRPAGNKANITWSPSVKDQEMLSGQGITGKFVVQYDINRETNSGEILLMEGYFVHFFAPEDLPPLRKHVVFVLDISGSMWGRKMEQLKESQKKILDDLSSEDFFNIITFSSDVSLWSPPSDDLPANAISGYINRRSLTDRNSRPYPATKENILKAKTFIDSLTPNGGTNIHDSIITALNLTKRIKDARDGTVTPDKISHEALPTALPFEDSTGTTLLPSFDEADAGVTTERTPEGPATGILPANVESLIMFLTDGEPTIGVTDPALIQKLIQTANANLTIPIFSLGFGEGADFPFLKKLSLQNYGFGRKIYEASDAAIQLKGFYNEIASPLLSKVAFNYTSPELNISDVTLTDFPTIFHGNEIIIAGKYTPVATPELNEFDDVEERSTDAPDNEAQADSIIEVTETSGTDSPVVFDDAPPKTSDNGLFVPNRNLLEVSISGSGREGVIDFDRPRLFCGFNPNFIPRPFPPRPTPPPTQEDQFLERLWAYLTIKQLIDRDLKGEDPSTNEVEEDPYHGEPVPASKGNVTKKETPKEHAIRLALKYKFVTPFTSLVVVKPNSSDVTDTVSSDTKPDFADSYAAPQSMAHFAALPPPSFQHFPLSAVSNRIAASPVRKTAYYSTTAGYHGYQGASYNFGPTPLLALPRPGLPAYQAPQLNQLLNSYLVPQSISAASNHADYGEEDGHNLSLETASEESTSSAPSETTAVTSTSSESPLSLSSIVWFNPKYLTLRINETEYKIALNSTTGGDNEGKSCEIKNESGSKTGQCQHLRTCVQSAFIDSMDTFTDAYFCPIESRTSSSDRFVGVCCPRKTRSSDLFEDP